MLDALHNSSNIEPRVLLTKYLRGPDWGYVWVILMIT